MNNIFNDYIKKKYSENCNDLLKRFTDVVIENKKIEFRKCVSSKFTKKDMDIINFK